MVKPETVIAWHRKGFRLYWRWKSRAGKCGRPCVSRETRELIRQISRATLLWGAPRIHGELLKLGIEISQATVAKYMVRQRKPLRRGGAPFLRPHSADSCNRFFGSNDVKLSPVVCVCSLGPPRAPRHSLQRHVPSDGRMDGTANRRSVSAG